MEAKTRKQQLEDLLADDPNDPFLRYGLAMEYLSEGDDEGAVQRFQELIAVAPEYVPAYLQIGQAFLRLGRPAKRANFGAAASQWREARAINTPRTRCKDFFRTWHNGRASEVYMRELSMNRITRWSMVVVGILFVGGLKPTTNAADDAKGAVVSLGNLKSKAPAGWKEVEPEGMFRTNQFKVPKADGDKADADIIVFFFGKGGGGSAEENVKRWKDMFAPPEGKEIDDVAKVEKFKVADAEVTCVNVQGTYKFKARPRDPNSKIELRPDHRMIAVFFGSDEGPFFIRFVGGAKTVAEHKKGFDEWLKGFK